MQEAELLLELHGQLDAMRTFGLPSESWKPLWPPFFTQVPSSAYMALFS